jgi:ACS family hexuronate transporter-like MFS transporter
LWIAVLVFGIVTATHQVFPANLYTPPWTYSFSASGGMVMARHAGFVLDQFDSYASLYTVATTAYLIMVALIMVAIIRLLMPRYACRRLAS